LPDLLQAGPGAAVLRLHAFELTQFRSLIREMSCHTAFWKQSFWWNYLL